MAIISNLILGCILLCAIWIPQKLGGKELRKIQRNVSTNRFNKLLIDQVVFVLWGVLTALFCNFVGMILASPCVVSPGAVQLVPAIVVLSVVTVFSKLLVDSKLVTKEKLPPYPMMYRISAVSFLIAAAFSVLSIRFPHCIAHGFSILLLLYYFVELYCNRHVFAKCFTLLETKEELEEFRLLSPVESINKKFVFICMIGMAVVVLLNYHRGVSLETVLYRNILSVCCVFIGLFFVQALATAIQNRFIAGYGILGQNKASKRSLGQRKRNWLWLCDLCVTACYAIALGATAFWMFGINILDFLVVDKSVIIIFIVFLSYVAYEAFGEFADAYVDRATSADRDKIQTFMPIVRVIFNVLLFFTAGLSILSQLGVAIGPFLASFAAVGAAVGLAAQDLVKGFLYGIILLIENNFYVGDFITINGQKGIVVKISTRTLTLRDFNGDEYSIPYNTIGVITNHSRDFFVHFEHLLVSPHADVKKAGELLIQVVNQMKTESQYAEKILGDVQITGIEAFSDEGLHICWSLKTSTAGRLLHLEIYRRLLPLLRDAGIPIPYKQEYTEHLLTADNQGEISVNCK